jgi:hypothetical protein
MRAPTLALALLLVASMLDAQQPDTVRAPADTTPGSRPAPADTGVKPIGAFFRSLIIPGWGQAAVGREVTGALFVVWEGFAWTMAIKAQDEANYLKRTASPNLGAKRQEVEDWVVLIVFNHLFAGAEAFVSAHLKDFPEGLEIRPAPRGVGFSVSLPLR